MINSGNHEGMLAGLCSRLANCLGWNVWAIRAVLLILLVAEPLMTALAYGLAALVVTGLDRHGKSRGSSPEAASRISTSPISANLESPELAGRKQRIDQLEQRFRKWEESLDKD